MNLNEYIIARLTNKSLAQQYWKSIIAECDDLMTPEEQSNLYHAAKKDIKAAATLYNYDWKEVCMTNQTD